MNQLFYGFIFEPNVVVSYFSLYLLAMDCGTGPDRLGYGGCAKGLILEENE